jgi:hypothetical protein
VNFFVSVYGIKRSPASGVVHVTVVDIQIVLVSVIERAEAESR